MTADQIGNRGRGLRPRKWWSFGRRPGWPSGYAAEVEFADFDLSHEDPMTDDRMALMEALQKADDGNFLRSLAETVLQFLMCRSMHLI